MDLVLFTWLHLNWCESKEESDMKGSVAWRSTFSHWMTTLNCQKNLKSKKNLADRINRVPRLREHRAFLRFNRKSLRTTALGVYTQFEQMPKKFLRASLKILCIACLKPQTFTRSDHQKKTQKLDVNDISWCLWAINNYSEARGQLMSVATSDRKFTKKNHLLPNNKLISLSCFRKKISFYFPLQPPWKSFRPCQRPILFFYS